MSILLSLLFACSTETTPAPVSPQQNTTANLSLTTTTTSNNAINLSNPVHSTLSATTSLPDLSQGLSREGCDNGPGESGAASYFVGELNISGNSVSGKEEWLLYANKKWKKHNGKDCLVRWNLNGSTTNTQACGSCTIGVSLTNALDLVDSTCPEDMAKNETGQSINYDIRLHDDGRAEVYFARSGKKVGEGYHQKGTIKYVSDMSCRWF